MILLDTSVLIDSFTADQRGAPALRRALESGEQLQVSALAVYEWMRGPRIPAELELQEELFPNERAIPFEVEDALLSARIYRSVRRARGREIDLAIAACAINREAPLWTLNPADFADIPGLQLYQPR